MTEKVVLAAVILCYCSVLALHHLPSAFFNRVCRGFIKIVVNAAKRRTCPRDSKSATW